MTNPKRYGKIQKIKKITREELAAVSFWWLVISSGQRHRFGSTVTSLII
jgi:hypothetical protein